MHSLFTFTTPAHECNYLPDQTARLHYELVSKISDEEYQRKLEEGWRHFGHSLFRPQCKSCRACQSLRVLVNDFRPNRSQRRAWRDNQDVVVTVGEPSVSPEKLELYDRFHAYQTDRQGWPEHLPKEAAGYHESFVQNPVSTREWTYHLNDKLIGVGYVDHLPQSLSAIYFFYDPDHVDRSLGTFNVMCLLNAARRRRLPHLYLGYFVEGCRSLQYKSNFVPNEVVDSSGKWVPFRA